MLLALALPALAAETPSLWSRFFSGAALQPGGVIAEGTGELRAPVLRYGGVAFNSTFVGAGARVALSPAHLDTALRLSLQPIDLLPITVELVRTTYWESPWGLVPIDRRFDIDSKGRRELYQADRDFAGYSLTFLVSPTLQARAGPVVGFSSFTFSFMSIRPRMGPEPWLVEPVRGLAMGYEDRLTEHTSAVLWEPKDGEDAPIVRLGGVLRGRASHVTHDSSLNAGLLMQWRPGRSPRAPTFLFLAAPYLKDPDFIGPIPNVAAAVTFERDQPLSRAP